MINGLLASLHLIDAHWDAYESGAWCSCVPQSVIDEFNLWHHALMRGYDLDKPEDQKRWQTDTYGRHDSENLESIMIRRYGVTWFESHNGVVTTPIYGRHRCLAFDEEVSMRASRECGRTRPHMIGSPEFGYRLCPTG